MNRRRAMQALAALPLGRGSRTAQEADTRWTPLFNGRDLSGWETFLGRPHRSSDLPLPKDASGDYTAVVGIDADPRGVFSVVQADGAPAIRISGEIYGALTTREEYERYHLRIEFKWGERKWPPREQALRDSGCCYHAVGPHGASYGFWMQSFEFQIQEGDCGDFYSLAGVIVDAEGLARTPGDPKTELIYRRGAPLVTGHTRRIVRAPVPEKPHGQWNTLDLYCVDQTSAHVVNGGTAMVVSGLRRRVDGREVPLTRGKIQLQSEAAEVFYRNVTIRPIRGIPSAVIG
jgi:hypothetical protein